ncbi:MAG: hypothetical protein ACOYMA_17375 [Bacteroidia bacterium]
MDKPEFFYLVNGRMFRKVKDETNPIEVYKVFKDKNPIIAREQAFSYYQSYIDVLLESKGKSYISHSKAEEELRPFLSSFKRQYVELSGQTIEDMALDVDCDKGLAISLIMSDSKSFLNIAGHALFEDSHLLHYIDNQFTDLKPYVLDELILEYSLYEKFGYDCKNYKIDFDISGLFEDPILKPILKTPIYFGSYDLESILNII